MEVAQVLSALTEQIRSENELQDQEQPVFSEAVLDVLTSTFPTVVNSALHIIEHGKVTKFVCENSRRSFYRVQESHLQSQSDEHQGKAHKERTGSGAVYFDILGDFCCCFFNTKQCMGQQGSSLFCKHVLATKLAEALSPRFEDKLQVKEIADLDF